MKKFMLAIFATVGALGVFAADRCLIIPKDTTFVVDSSAADYQEKLGIMSTNDFLYVDNGAVVEFNLDSTVDLTLGTRITACYSSTQHSGKLVKKGAGILRFETARKSSNDYNLDIDVQAGELHLPEKYEISTQYGQNINVAAGAVYATSTNNVFTFDRLTGAGTVIGFGTFIIREDCEFAGDIHMAIYRTVQAWKHFKMSGSGSTYKSQSHLIANNVLENGVITSRGIIELTSPSAFPSSGDQDFWTQNSGGEFRLHGNAETAWSYAHRLDVRANGSTLCCDAMRDEGLATFSAVTGNFTWSTGWRFAYGFNNLPGVWQFTLTGDNTEYPATLSGYIQESVDKTTGARNVWALRKRGIGIWQIKKNNSTSWSGPLFVENGTLQYDTLAAAGVNCALGFATNLYKPTWTNIYEDLGYAIGVGCATNLAWTGLLEYTGSTAVPMKTRPVRVLGAGGFKSGAVDTDWSDITAENDNSTLVLAGPGTGDNVVRDLDDGDGKLSIRKEGTGTWRLAEPVTATGDIAVNGGKLLLNNGKGAKYTWYRFIVKENGIVCPRYEAEHELMPTNSAAEYPICTFYQFCFYDKDGNQIMTDSNMTLLDSIPATATTLRRGEYSFDPEHTPNNPSATYKQLADCFRGSGSFSLNAAKDSGMSSHRFDRTREGSWGGLVWRLPEGAADPVSMDFLDVQGLSRNTDGKATSGARCVTAWRLQGSVDGERWETILDKDDQDIPPKSMSWGSNLAYVDQKHDGYTLPNIISAGIDNYLENPGTLSVAAGATLEVFGVLPFDSLRLDAKNGAGTFNGVTFAESGTVDLVGGQSDVAATFVNSPSVTNVANWTVTRNGLPCAYRIRPTENGFHVISPGVVFFIR